MDLLPRSHQEFGSEKYWDTFFKKRGSKAFEWYGEYPELCGILHKYIKTADKLLVIGCGNSKLSEDLYDVGYNDITNIDISETVINQMLQKNTKQRPKMTYMKMDMTQMEFEDASFSVILDKGTLDAVMTDGSEDVKAFVEKMFNELSRVLKVGGRYICITLAQDHIIKEVMKIFTEFGWMIRVCRITDASSEDRRDFHLPVFALVLTKFKKIPNMKQILELSQYDESIERFDTSEQLVHVLKSIQYYGMVRNQLNNKSVEGEHISVQLHSPDSDVPRFTLHIVDICIRTGNKFAVFIVPEGRETEWLFSTHEGRIQLAHSAGFLRLLVVTLHSSHTYGSLDDVKAELSTRVLDLAPHNLGNFQVPFLSLGDGINKRKVKYRGTSEFSGDFVVEDVEVDGEMRRRLIFLKSRNIVQSEAKLVKEIVKKKGKNRPTGKWLLDPTYVTSERHHWAMIGGLAMVEDSPQKFDETMAIAVIGVGGGGLLSSLHRFFPQLYIEGVELDPAILKCATDWFGLKLDEKLQVHVGDGLEYIERLNREGLKKDIIIIDVDNKDVQMGIMAPPKPFIEVNFLKKVDNVLNSSGVLIMNICCRQRDLRDDIIKDLKSVYSLVSCCKMDEHVNEILFALPSHRHSLKAEGSKPGDDMLASSLELSLDALQTVIRHSGGEDGAEDVVHALRKLSLT